MFCGLHAVELDRASSEETPQNEFFSYHFFWLVTRVLLKEEETSGPRIGNELTAVVSVKPSKGPRHSRSLTASIVLAFLIK
jgi:hypothetical protein